LNEDIGIAERSLPSTIRALYDNYQLLKTPGSTCYESKNANVLPLVHAIMLMATSKKSRAVDHALIVHFHGPEEEREIPDYCVDFHSPLGRRQGKDWTHFLTVGAHLENESSDVVDEWKEKVLKLAKERQ
jgi:hypothetical protein